MREALLQQRNNRPITALYQALCTAQRIKGTLKSHISSLYIFKRYRNALCNLLRTKGF